jgi:hypothetical protein
MALILFIQQGDATTIDTDIRLVSAGDLKHNFFDLEANGGLPSWSRTFFLNGYPMFSYNK